MKLIARIALILLSTGLFLVPDGYCQSKSSTVKNTHRPDRTNRSNHTTDHTAAYVNAISEYIKDVYVNGVVRPDTLFIGKNVDMPNIKLPNSIEGITTVLITSEAAQNKLSYRKSLVYLNVVGWPERDKSEFIIVRFNEFKPQHNCTIHFKRNIKTRQMELESLKFDYPNGQKTK